MKSVKKEKRINTNRKEKLTADQKRIIFENAEFISLTSFDSNGHRLKLGKETEDLIRLKILCSF